MNLTIFGANKLALFVLVAFFMGLNASCDSRNNSNSFDYGTKNDSARFYYLKGFHEILDNGRWTESEKSYRKALEFDPDYRLGKSLVGRITTDLDEREALLEELQKNKGKANEDEKLVLEVYLLSMEAYNNRDKGIKGTAERAAKRKQIAESNFRKFVHNYPNDTYIKAEYIEWLHFIHGPRAALDSLKKLATKEQMKLGFYISYAASLALELDKVEEAITLSKTLQPLMIDSTYTSYLKLKAEIYIAQDSLQKAKHYIDQVVKIDPKHIIALGLQSDITAKLKNK